MSFSASGQSQFSVKGRLDAATASALTGLEARGGFIDDVNTALAAHKLVVAMAGLQGFERILDLHDANRSDLAPAGNEKRAVLARDKCGGAINEDNCVCQPRVHLNRAILGVCSAKPGEMPHFTAWPCFHFTIVVNDNAKFRAE